MGYPPAADHFFGYFKRSFNFSFLERSLLRRNSNIIEHKDTNTHSQAKRSPYLT
jgi:hypothetical protein